MRRFLAIAIVFCALAIPAAARAASYAPIDCAKAQARAQVAICRTYALGQDEARMATLFGVATGLVAMGQRGDIEDAQTQWLKRRDSCGAKLACLTRAYQARIAQLNKIIDEIESGGPY